MSQSPFKKFIAPKKNSVKKEEIRQEKKQYRKEKNAYFDKLKEEKYQARMAAKNPATKKGESVNTVNRSAVSSTKAVAGQKTTDVVMPLRLWWVI